ncbi:MAG: LysM peptidoglycan-binding domain-containing M23 family metallopeptidase [Chloroflexota bacterium]|nr:MAG: LysM peptidoglycan-binding domain-containing M23 family metallopeptidase [Chloroflexota bacterium]
MSSREGQNSRLPILFNRTDKRSAWVSIARLALILPYAFYSAGGILSRGPQIASPASGTPWDDTPVHHSISGDDDQKWQYFSQPGDTLKAVAARFQVRLQDIGLNTQVIERQLLDPGTLLIIPRPPLNPYDFPNLIPDHEVVYSPSGRGFDTLDYVSKAGGYLSTHQEYMRSTSLTSAAEIVERVAIENSIHPRLLLALLEYQCGCVRGPLKDGFQAEYLMGVNEVGRRGLYRQLGWVVNQLSLGYYGWRRGLLTDMAFESGDRVHLPPDANAGTVAVAYLFSRLYDREGWEQAMDSPKGFAILQDEMFAGSVRSENTDMQLFPPGLQQPDLSLPFQLDKLWGYTSGPHPAWETEGALAALDFAPASEQYGCTRSDAWVVAAADGLIARSEHGAVILDLDQDGFEETGWVILYMHVEDRQRVAEGTFLKRGDKIGHPSCEGGPADGTHVHIARKYNGEWIAADGPLPFMMSGWTAHAGFRPYSGSLTRGTQRIIANPLSPAAALISLSDQDLPLDLKISRDLWWEK